MLVFVLSWYYHGIIIISTFSFIVSGMIISAIIMLIKLSTAPAKVITEQKIRQERRPTWGLLV